MRVIAPVLLILVAIVIQGTMLVHLQLGGPVVDLVLVLVVILAMLAGPGRGAAFGAVSGLLEDMCFGRPLGVSSMSRLLVCWAVGNLESSVFRESALAPAVIVFLATLADRALQAVFVRMIGAHVSPGLDWRIGDMAAPIGDFLATIAVYGVVRRFYDRVSARRRARAY